MSARDKWYADPWVQLWTLVLVVSGAAAIHHFAPRAAPASAVPSIVSAPRPFPTVPTLSSSSRPASPVDDDTDVTDPREPADAGTMIEPRTPGRWIVDATAAPDSDTSTIIQAVLNSRKGDLIEVRPGIYDEYFSVDKDLTIRGVGGSATKVVLGNERDHTLLMLGGEVTIENLSIRQDLPDGRDGLTLYGIRMTAGTLKLSGVEVTAQDSPAIHLEGGTLDGAQTRITGGEGIHILGGIVKCRSCDIGGAKGGIVVDPEVKICEVSISDSRVEGSSDVLLGKSRCVVKSN